MVNKVEFKIFGDIDDLKKSLGDAEKGFKSLSKNAGLAFAGFTASSLGFVNAAREQEEAINQMNQALKNSGNFSESASRDLQKYASSLQEVSLFGDETIIKAQAMIASFGFQGDTLKGLTKATLDLAQAQGIDLVTAAGLVARSAGSSTNALARQGIEINGLAGSTLRATSVIDGINKRFGGQAQAATQGLGAIKQLQNSLSDLGEDIGLALAPTVIKFTENLRDLVNVAKQHPEVAKMGAAFLIVGTGVTGLLTVIGLAGVGIINFLKVLTVLNGQVHLVAGTLFTTLGALQLIAGVGIAAFAGWKLGELIGEVTGLNEALSGTDGILTKIFSSRNKAEQEANDKTQRESLAARGLTPDDVEAFKAKKQEEIEVQKAALAEQEQIQAQHEQTMQELKRQTDEFIKGSDAELLELSKVNNDQDLANLLQKWEQERNAQLEHLNLKLQLLQDNGVLEVAEKENIEAQKKAIEDKYRLLTEQAEKKSLNDRLQLKKFFQAAEVQSVENTLQQLATINKSFARVAQAISLGQAVINVALGITKALSHGDFVSAAIIAAQGGIQIASIAAQSFAVGTDSVPRDTIAQIHKKEMIVPATFSDAIRRGNLTLGGPSGGSSPNPAQIIFDFTGAQFNGITDYLVEKIFTKASENMANGTLAFRGAI